jgi:hypothetical protein
MDSTARKPTLGFNCLLAKVNFDRWIEDRGLPYYDNKQPCGQKSIPLGTDFRTLAGRRL